MLDKSRMHATPFIQGEMYLAPAAAQARIEGSDSSCSKFCLGCREQARAGREAIVPKKEPQGSEEKGLVRLQQAVAT